MYQNIPRGRKSELGVCGDRHHAQAEDLGQAASPLLHLQYYLAQHHILLNPWFILLQGSSRNRNRVPA